MQYGPRFRGLAVYLNAAHFVPLGRTSEILEATCGARPSDGTIALNLNLAAARLEGFEIQLKAALRQQPVLHADETGSTVNGTLQWMPGVNCAQLTLYGHHPRRGFAAVEAINVFSHYAGVLVHDAWSPYFRLPARPALCGAHLLRELRGLAEHHPQVWAGDLRDALRRVYHQYKSGTLTSEMKMAFEQRFMALLDAGLQVNPPAPPVSGRRGRTKQSPGQNLALRFLHDEGVPVVDNNQAERDVRPWCVKRKVSGGFRSDEGG